MVHVLEETRMRVLPWVMDAPVSRKGAVAMLAMKRVVQLGNVARMAALEICSSSGKHCAGNHLRACFYRKRIGCSLSPHLLQEAVPAGCFLRSVLKRCPHD
jgi:hypothetical protein